MSPILRLRRPCLHEDREMTLHSEPRAVASADLPLTQHDIAVLDRFSQLVTERVDALAQGRDRRRVLNLVKRAVAEVQEEWAGKGDGAQLRAVQNPCTLPVSKLKVSEVVGQGWVQLSQASFYRAVDSKRFYCVTPPGRAIGKEFPAWQFVSPVPELMPAVLDLLGDMPGSEIHAFWVSEADELNDLSPAEVLAGQPFEVRQKLHASQRSILGAPVQERARRVAELAGFRSGSMADLIG